MLISWLEQKLCPWKLLILSGIKREVLFQFYLVPTQMTQLPTWTRENQTKSLQQQWISTVWHCFVVFLWRPASRSWLVSVGLSGPLVPKCCQSSCSGLVLQMFEFLSAGHTQDSKLLPWSLWQIKASRTKPKWRKTKIFFACRQGKTDFYNSVRD